MPAETINLDIKDKKLLYHLSSNARLSHTQLVKKIGLSKNAVKYRIERLKKEGVITQFACVINLGAINAGTIALLLKFNEDIYEKKEIIDYFKNFRLANWVATLSGHWDIFAEIITPNLYSVEEIINEIREHFGAAICTYQTFFSNEPLRVEHFVEDIYKDLGVAPPPVPERKIKKYVLDKTDREILYLLNQDSTMPYTTIAQKLDISIDIVIYRIKNLFEKGVLIKFFPELSRHKLGYSEHLCTIQLRNASSERLMSIKKRIQTNTNISYAFYDATRFSLVFVCAFSSPDDIDHLLRQLRKDYSDIIELQDYLIIKEHILFNLFPRGLLETT